MPVVCSHTKCLLYLLFVPNLFTKHHLLVPIVDELPLTFTHYIQMCDKFLRVAIILPWIIISWYDYSSLNTNTCLLVWLTFLHLVQEWLHVEKLTLNIIYTIINNPKLNVYLLVFQLWTFIFMNCNWIRVLQYISS